ncbi:isopropylmalate/homocitrate/citramalate synthase [Bernardetia litoralis DSM 6794]|uniref:Isopropylmalate/homocitrate/citramalate synthase n=1 Tax=Bernardetia litoralis (strain ATCC 23117 / DSM 6794 / NBRC 15988 / NCIMB 1366 / Fx l1 / Sio-4) TaxID=880071 RepID=I4AGD6_BERLS|nr:hydroxymethylglutaryl-CoA lyase [Bernardetia litoralis]AFM03021.1 isopropylmalate/homocitrate/citramalate synthase [Bernardetia litoralis DSM 6794]
MLKIIECPRDAMQGLSHFIDTDIKINYLNSLLKVGFDTLDFGSFVSEKAIPQMKDTAEVLESLDLSDTTTKLLAVIAGYGGLKRAIEFDKIDYLGFPLSISETFQIRNTKKTVEEALNLVSEAQNLCLQRNKTLVVYLSMAFGNPYKEAYSPEIVGDFMRKLDKMEIKIVQLSDTIGSSTKENIIPLFKSLTKEFSHIEIGAHFHSPLRTANEKIEAAYQAGCRRFDGAMLGFGGCPMAKDELTGNIPTESILAFAKMNDIQTGLDMIKFNESLNQAKKVFV